MREGQHADHNTNTQNTKTKRTHELVSKRETFRKDKLHPRTRMKERQATKRRHVPPNSYHNSGRGVVKLTAAWCGGTLPHVLRLTVLVQLRDVRVEARKAWRLRSCMLLVG